MFFLCIHLAERPVEIHRAKKRIVAKAFVAARRPYRNAINTALKFFDVPIRPGNAQRCNEMRAPLFGRFGTALDQ